MQSPPSSRATCAEVKMRCAPLAWGSGENAQVIDIGRLTLVRPLHVHNAVSELLHDVLGGL